MVCRKNTKHNENSQNKSIVCNKVMATQHNEKKMQTLKVYQLQKEYNFIEVQDEVYCTVPPPSLRLTEMKIILYFLVVFLFCSISLSVSDGRKIVYKYTFIILC